MNMAETMKAFVFLGVGKVGIIEKPLPEPGPRDAVIRTTASFICTSETGLSLWARHAARLPPPWTGVVLDVRGTTNDPGAAMRAAVGTHPDVLFGPYGSSTMLAAIRVTDRVVWNHGGATSMLSHPVFPQVINVLSPASTYFTGVLQAVRAIDSDAATVSIFHASSGFGRDVANGAASTAANLNFEVQTVSYEPHHATESAPIVPDPAAQAFAAGLLCARCLRESGTSEDAVQFAMAKQLVCTTLYGGFRLDPVSGLQVGHQVLVVQWQNGIRGILLTTSDPTDP